MKGAPTKTDTDRTMHRDGHRGIALLLMLPLTGLFGIVGFAMTVVAVAVCRLPDLDHDHEWLPHRGPTHTVWFALGIGALACAGLYVGLLAAPVDLPAWPIALLAGTTVFFGIISHLLADALTVGRGDHAVRPFRPVSPLPLRFGLFRADSRSWNAGFLVGGIVGQVLALCWFYVPSML